MPGIGTGTAHDEFEIRCGTECRPRGTRLMAPQAGASLSAPRAGVAKLADARDSKSREAQTSCGFDPHLRHQSFKHLRARHISSNRPSEGRTCSNGARSRFGQIREAQDSAHRTRTNTVKSRNLSHALGKVGLGDNRVAPVDALGLVAAELHRHRARHARPLEVSNCRAAQVVDQAPGHANTHAGTAPDIVEATNRPPVSMERPGDEAILLALQRRGVLPLRAKQSLQPRQRRE